MLLVDSHKISLALPEHKLTVAKATPKIQGEKGILHFYIMVGHTQSRLLEVNVRPTIYKVTSDHLECSKSS